MLRKYTLDRIESVLNRVTLGFCHGSVSDTVIVRHRKSRQKDLATRAVKLEGHAAGR
jgi:hypothetical protein